MHPLPTSKRLFYPVAPATSTAVGSTSPFSDCMRVNAMPLPLAAEDPSGAAYSPAFPPVT